jgi:hypothetical protein
MTRAEKAVNQVEARAANRADNPVMTAKAAAKKQAVVGVRKAAAVRKAVALVAAIVKRYRIAQLQQGGFRGTRPCYQRRNR